MTFRLAEHGAESEDVVIGEIIVEAAAQVMTFSVSVTIGKLFCNLSRVVMIFYRRVVVIIAIIIFCQGVAIADVVAIVEVIVSEYVKFLKSIIDACAQSCLERKILFEELLSPLYREAATKIDGSIKTFTFVFFQDYIDDAGGTFSVITHRRVCHHFYLLYHISLEATERVLSADAS